MPWSCSNLLILRASHNSSFCVSPVYTPKLNVLTPADIVMEQESMPFDNCAALLGLGLDRTLEVLFDVVELSTDCAAL